MDWRPPEKRFRHPDRHRLVATAVPGVDCRYSYRKFWGYLGTYLSTSGIEANLLVNASLRSGSKPLSRGLFLGGLATSPKNTVKALQKPSKTPERHHSTPPELIRNPLGKKERHVRRPLLGLPPSKAISNPQFPWGKKE